MPSVQKTRLPASLPAVMQAKRIDNTSARDEPYVFKLGAHEVGGRGTCLGWAVPLRSPKQRPLQRAISLIAPQPAAVLPTRLLPPPQAIPAFEEAVAGMRVGGVRRVEVLGEIPKLSYPRDRSQRFVSGFK